MKAQGIFFILSLLLLHKAADIDLLHMRSYCFDPWHPDREVSQA